MSSYQKNLGMMQNTVTSTEGASTCLLFPQTSEKGQKIFNHHSAIIHALLCTSLPPTAKLHVFTL